MMEEVYSIFIDYGGDYEDKAFLCVSVESARENTVKIVNEEYMWGVDMGQENNIPLSVSITPLTANAEGILKRDRSSTKVLKIKNGTISETILDIINFYEVFSLEEGALR